ncbi:MAG: NADH-quinone oxidoreductase subunit L [Gammaproteobacteria bacterium]|nr:NADH-quinone oxidoreductase subunit L [Gammaproteobacteria bacterium]
MQTVYLLVPLVCLVPAIIAGLFGWKIGRVATHLLAISGVALACGLSVWVFLDVLAGNEFNGTVYAWGVTGGIPLEMGFLIDRLTATMMVVVTFVSLMVHIYTVGYMREDPGYQRFFSYIALFTFAMLMLVMSNNFLQLFFGWEAVGLVSYLLIGFWFQKESAIAANLKAFLVNRVGDLGFLLGIALVLMHFGSLDYAAVFASAPHLAGQNVELFAGHGWDLMTVITILLFIGAMGKSAQVPLHVWLPDSMEGPTPISALIHAATMVTAGIYMVARMSPLFELSEVTLNVVMVIGSLTAFFMALVGLVQTDIKRVVAYSTLSQLGYMTVALGASAYSAAIFHLATHAFFKALLFLAAGSVIIALHHQQDMRKMGGLRRAMPWTWLTAWIGTLALVGIPPFAGFFSKDAIIEAVQLSQLGASGIALVAVTAGVFVTSLYSFRLLFLVFHGRTRMDEKTRDHAQESPWVVTLPLVLLAIPSVIVGFLYLEPMVFGNFFGEAIQVAPAHDVLGRLAEEYHGKRGSDLLLAFLWHGVQGLPFLFAVAGLIVAWFLYLEKPDLPGVIHKRLGFFSRILEHKYGFDEFNRFVFAGGARRLGGLLWKIGDVRIIDGGLVNGSARLVGWVSAAVRQVQSGFVYHYAFAMIIGLFVLLTLFLKL